MRYDVHALALAAALLFSVTHSIKGAFSDPLPTVRSGVIKDSLIIFTHTHTRIHAYTVFLMTTPSPLCPPSDRLLHPILSSTDVVVFLPLRCAYGIHLFYMYNFFFVVRFRRNIANHRHGPFIRLIIKHVIEQQRWAAKKTTPSLGIVAKRISEKY